MMAESNSTSSTADDNNFNLDMLKGTFRLEIERELKKKEEAKKLFTISIDRKMKCDLIATIKDCDEKLSLLQLQLSDLQAQVTDDDGVLY